jgi:Delta7-sterol 5-desaturase
MPTPHSLLTSLALIGGTLLLIFSVRTALFAGLAILWTRTSAWARRRRVYVRDIPRAQIVSELKATVPVLLMDATVGALLIHFELLHRQPEPSLLHVLGTFALIFAWYELWFYATHRLLHTRPLYFLHRQHHVANVVDPFASMSFSLAERALLQLGALGFAVAVSRVVPLAVPGLVLYLLTNHALNVLAHTNVEFLPARFPRSWLGRLFISGTFHALHHARLQGHYGLFTPILDRLLGTCFQDYPQVHTRAASGQGLSTLGERCEVDSPTPPSATAHAT